MRAKYTFEIMDLDDDMVAVPIGYNGEQFKGVLKINETASSILRQLETDTTEEKIVDALMLEYSGDRKEIADCVHEFVEYLKAEEVVE